MKKKALIILIFGVALIALGAIYEFSNNRGTNKQLNPAKETDTIINDENNTEEEPKIDDNSLNETVNFSGKYSNDFGELFIYHDNFFKYDMYFIVNNDTYGKASINDNIASGTKNNKTYQFVFNGSTLTVESNDPNVSGTYQKVNDLMREEYFNLRYGDYDYLISQYNRCYTSEKMDIKMYRATKDKVYVFIDSLDGKKVFIKFNINIDQSLTGEYNGSHYQITLNDQEMTFNKNDGEEEKLTLDYEMIALDVFDLFVEYL